MYIWDGGLSPALSKARRNGDRVRLAAAANNNNKKKNNIDINTNND